jgi:phage terminase small subunit
MVKKPTRGKTAGQRAVEDRYARFVAEYLLSNNSTQAAIKAGYTRKTASTQGNRLLRDARIQKMVEDGRREVHRAAAEKLEVSSERVIQALASIGFSDVRRAISWSTVDHVRGVGKKAVTERRTEFELVDSDKLDDATAAAIAGVRMTAHGPRLDFYDKPAALVHLGKITGLFKDGGDVTVPVSFVVERVDR